MQTDGLKIIFQDIDGCLNPADGEHFSVIAGEMPSPNQASMLDAINQAVEASPIEHFIINSGRPLSMVHPILTHLTTPKARYVLLEHACVLFDLAEDPREQTDLADDSSASDPRRRLEAALIERLYGEDLAWIEGNRLVGFAAPTYTPVADRGLAGQRGLHYPQPPLGQPGRVVGTP